MRASLEHIFLVTRERVLLSLFGCFLHKITFPRLGNVTDAHRKIHRELGKIRREGNIFQMMKQDKTTGKKKKKNKVEISNLLVEELMVMI